MTLHRGYDLPSSKRVTGKYPIISSSGISGYHNEYKVDGPNVVTGRYGTIGEVYYHEGPCWPLNTALYVSDFMGNSPRYAAYLLELMLKSMYSDGTDKSTVPGVDRNVIHQLKAPFVEGYEKQERLINPIKLLDAKIANNKKLITELESTAQLIYDFWFTQFDFPDENGKPYRTSGGKMVLSDVLKREIPVGWEIGAFKDVATLISGATPSTSTEDNYQEEGIAWITPDDLSRTSEMMFIDHGKRDISALGLQSCSARLLPAGTLILSSRAPIGYTALALNECCTNQGCKSFVPNKGYGSYFIYHLVNRLMPLIKAQGVGTTFKEVSKETLEQIIIVLPPKEVAKNFEKAVEKFCAGRKTLESENRELLALRNWLLPMLMNGQAQIGD